MTPMEEIRRAAALMSAQETDDWCVEVSLWLTDMAHWCSLREQARDKSYVIDGDRHALAVARAYLGAQP